MNKLFKIAIIPLIVFMVAACGEQKQAEEELLRPVRYVTISNEADTRTRNFTGTSRSTLQSRLSFKVSGTITELPIQVGDELQQGDLVARLDASQYEIQAQQYQATLVQARANERNAEANYDRVKGLYENNNASRNELDSARANAESAVAQVRAAEKQLELARLNVSDSTLRAATDCSIASVEVEVNENISSGSPVAVVNCGDTLEVGISVPESLIADISAGMAAEISFNAIPDTQFEGRISELGIAAQADATFPVIVEVLSNDPELRAGLAAEVRFQMQREEGQAFILPLAAILNDTDGTFVFVADAADGSEEAVLRRQPVETGELTEDGIEVLSGLTSGDRVVTAGVTLVRAGMRVQI